MQEGFIVLGEFTGSFYTLQNFTIDVSLPFPTDDAHKVKVYKGKLENARFHQEFKLDDFRRLNSFYFEEVPQVEIVPAAVGAPFPGTRVYNFKKLLLIDPRVVKTYDVNGKTYGVITSLAYGLTEKSPLIGKLDGSGGDNPGTPNPQKGPRPIPIPDSQGDNPDAPDGTKPPVIGQGVIGTVKDITDQGKAIAKGCWSRLWDLILILIAIFLFLTLLRSCNHGTDYCELQVQKERELQIEQSLLDTVRADYENNLDRALMGVSTIYFYRNSIEFHASSNSPNGPLYKLANIVKLYDDKQFLIEGFHSGKDIDTITGLDLDRANKMRDFFKINGTDEARLSVSGKGDSVLLDPSRRLDIYMVDLNSRKEYNRNMRVEVKPVKPLEP